MPGRAQQLLRPVRRFGPRNVAGLKLWLKSDTGVYSDAGVTPAVNNDTVQQWNDQSGVGNHLTQATSSKRPSFLTGILNGLPALKGDGVDDNLFTLAATGIAINGTSFTLTAVVKTNTPLLIVQVPMNIGCASVTGGKVLRIPEDANGHVMALKGGVGVLGSSSTAMITNTAYVVTFDYNSPNGTFYFNGVSGGTLSSAQTFAATTAEIYALAETNAGTNSTSEHIFEIIYYDNQISAGNRAALHRYLGSKYGLF